MYDQSFSSKTLQEIFDSENRKGNNLEDRFRSSFSLSIAKAKQIKALNRTIRETSDAERRKTLREQRNEIKKERGKIISSTLESIETRIANIRTIDLELGGDYGGQSYKLENSVECFFLSKKLQNNIRKMYDVKQASRFSILSEVITLIEDEFPKIVIRTDIKSFYESIPQKNLINKINDDYLLSIKSKLFINQIINSYNNLTGQSDPETAKGLPRGIGISAYLSELFMRKIDNEVKQIDDVIYYGRYVDDIIVIIVPSSKNGSSHYKTEIERIITHEGLSLNPNKTREYDLRQGVDSLELERIAHGGSVTRKLDPQYISFLGYHIGFSLQEKERRGSIKSRSICIGLSDRKTQKYKDKIKKSFSAFNAKKGHNRAKALKLLGLRLCYLTNNTKLRNSKEKVFVGIYYSNPFLTDFNSLEILQKSLSYYISRAGLNPLEKQKMLQYNFTNGFSSRQVVLFPLQSKRYNNHNCKRNDVINRNNRGVILGGIKEIVSIW